MDSRRDTEKSSYRFLIHIVISAFFLLYSLFIYLSWSIYKEKPTDVFAVLDDYYEYNVNTSKKKWSWRKNKSSRIDREKTQVVKPEEFKITDEFKILW